MTGQRFGKLMVLTQAPSRKGETFWLCRCECGVRKEMRVKSIVKCSSCGCNKHSPENNAKRGRLTATDLTSKRFGMLVVLQRQGSRKYDMGSKPTWLCLCDCGKRRVVVGIELLRGNTWNCGCESGAKLRGDKNNAWKGCGQLGQAYFHVVEKGAAAREIPLQITIQDAWGQFQKQAGKCAYTGVELTLRNSKYIAGVKCTRRTASLDRIDSTKGYTIDNIQWVHKTIQLMKNTLSDADFKAWCLRVTAYQAPLCNDEVEHETAPQSNGISNPGDHPVPSIPDGKQS